MSTDIAAAPDYTSPEVELAIANDALCELRVQIEHERLVVAQLTSQRDDARQQRDNAQRSLDNIADTLNSASIARGSETSARVRCLIEERDALYSRLKNSQKLLDDAGVPVGSGRIEDRLRALVTIRDGLHGEIRHLEAVVADEKQRHEATVRDATELLGKADKTIAELRNELEDTRELAIERLATITRLEGERDLAREDFDRTAAIASQRQRELDRALDDTQRAKVKILELEQLNAHMGGEYDRLRGVNLKLVEEVEAVKAEHGRDERSRAGLRSQIDAMHVEYGALEATIAQLDQQLRALATDRDKERAHVAKLQSDLAACEKRVHEAGWQGRNYALLELTKLLPADVVAEIDDRTRVLGQQRRVDAIAAVFENLTVQLEHAYAENAKARDVVAEEIGAHRKAVDACSAVEHELTQTRACVTALTVDLRKYRALYEGQKLETEFAQATSQQLLAEVRKVKALIAYERAVRTGGEAKS